ncbi:Retrovirus-related Pol polyprotein from transposon [Sesamum alatum]|uniref:Retrovirus-related Pol polyprotein from transposon n=1 Tax=Sesamum alatum TaxID=300844 RepID=A0AAE1YS98_9LAMI|nr:Retrovirus-related Pol polyprotein from transposon [Sesamum alatum]
MAKQLIVSRKSGDRDSFRSFGVTSVEYLGHIIANGIVFADPAKVQVMQDWPTPASITALRGFLGLTGSYGVLSSVHSTIRHDCCAFTNLLRANSFVWTPSATTTFEALKAAMVSVASLHLPNFALPFEVTTNASQVAVGAVLSQQRRPITFFSKKMSLRMQHSSAYEREMYAITEAVRKWHHFLLGCHFHIFTDQRSLRRLLNLTIQTPGQHGWLTKLLGYDFDITYTPGKDNIVADALSCHTTASVLLSWTNSDSFCDEPSGTVSYSPPVAHTDRLINLLAAAWSCSLQGSSFYT